MSRIQMRQTYTFVYNLLCNDESFLQNRYIPKRKIRFRVEWTHSFEFRGLLYLKKRNKSLYLGWAVKCDLDIVLQYKCVGFFVVYIINSQECLRISNFRRFNTCSPYDHILIEQVRGPHLNILVKIKGHSYCQASSKQAIVTELKECSLTSQPVAIQNFVKTTPRQASIVFSDYLLTQQTFTQNLYLLFTSSGDCICVYYQL